MPACIFSKENTMNKRITALFLMLLFNLIFAQFAGGSGTVEDPYQVATAEQLNNIRNYMTSSFVQIAHIDLGVAPWNEGAGWDPIGDYNYSDPSKSFRGNYDGGDYKISNMYINRPVEPYLGLFGSTAGCVLNKITSQGVNIIGGAGIGCLVGISYDDTIKNCFVEGTIEGHSEMGLLAYFFEGNSIENCHVKGEIKSTGGGWIGGMISMCNSPSVINCSAEVKITSYGYVTGGLIGQVTDVELIENCYVICDISSTDSYTAGLFAIIVQVNKNTTVKKCFTRGNIISSNDRVGGFLGQIGLSYESGDYLSISNCFSKINVSGNDRIGGFVGRITEATTIENCYSTGQVIGNSNVGGFIGPIDSLNSVTVTNSYWDTETSGIDSSAAGEGRTTAEMIYPYAANTYVDWDFSTVWRDDVINQNNGYPTFLWVSGIEENEDDFIAGERGLELYQNYPNPFNPVTSINFALSKASEVKLSVYNISGQIVAELVNGTKQAGLHTVDFDGSKLNSGVYYYTLEADGLSITKKMVLTK